ncbi:MAG: NADPH-dependent FMN reductase [Ilumatobacteraceae bacterium]|nr:NADPH-dependent FMN reductase [Ilumatobacteraceae bacterium]
MNTAHTTDTIDTADATSSTPTIGVLVGSLSSTSINRTLARSLTGLIGERAHVAEIEIGDLPLYNSDLDETPPEAVRRFKREVSSVDGLIVVTPEYNRTMSAVLKNAFEWGSRPYGESIWAGIPAGLVGASPGAIGTATAQQHVRNVMSFLDMPTLAQPEVYLQFRPEVFTDDGRISDAGTRGFLAGWADRFVDHVRLHADARLVAAGSRAA